MSPLSTHLIHADFTTDSPPPGFRIPHNEVMSESQAAENKTATWTAGARTQHIRNSLVSATSWYNDHDTHKTHRGAGCPHIIQSRLPARGGGYAPGGECVCGESRVHQRQVCSKQVVLQVLRCTPTTTPPQILSLANSQIPQTTHPIVSAHVRASTHCTMSKPCSHMNCSIEHRHISSQQNN